VHTDRCGNTGRLKCNLIGSGKEVKMQQFRCRDTANVELKCLVNVVYQAGVLGGPHGFFCNFSTV
jgi:hypothetical protein